jgi:sulfide:quinone oxidoreductase
MKQDYVQIKALEVDTQVYVAGQLFEHDIRLAAKQGVKSIMNNRPDGEAPGQPANADLARVAGELGIKYVFFPIIASSVTREDVDNFAKACEALERPLLIFCRSGARSTRMWELAESI